MCIHHTTMTIDTIHIMINNACAPLTLVFVFCSDPRRVAPLAIANKAEADRRKSFMVQDVGVGRFYAIYVGGDPFLMSDLIYMDRFFLEFCCG